MLAVLETYEPETHNTSQTPNKSVFTLRDVPNASESLIQALKRLFRVTNNNINA